MLLDNLNTRFYNLTLQPTKNRSTTEYKSKDKYTKNKLDKFEKKSLAEYMANALRKEYKQDEDFELEEEQRNI